MYVVDKQHLKEVLTDVSPVGKEFSEEFLREAAVLQRCPVIHIARRKLPLYDFALVIDDQMQLEAIEPSHGTLALGRPALHRLVHVHPLNVTRHQRCGVYDGFAVVIGVNVVCICLIVTYKGTKNISLLQLFEHFSYIELTLNPWKVRKK